MGKILKESSNREEKNKNMIKAEDLQISKVGTTTLLQDELEEIANCHEFYRYFTLIFS